MLRVFVESLSTRLCAPRIQSKARAPCLGAATRGVEGDCDAQLLPKCTKTSKELIPQKWSYALEKRNVDVEDLQRWKALEGSATCFESTTSSIIATPVLFDRLESNSTGFPKFTESRMNFVSASYDSVRFRPNLVARHFSTGFLNSASACGGGGVGGGREGLAFTDLIQNALRLKAAALALAIALWSIYIALRDYQRQMLHVQSLDETELIAAQPYFTPPLNQERKREEREKKADMDFEDFQRQMRRVESLDAIELPTTVKRWTTKRGTKIFLVGTIHYTSQYCDDVSKTIQAVEPDAVMVEVCEKRKSQLSRDSCRESEFRRAFKETEKLREKKECQLYLGDRNFAVTMRRLSVNRKLRLILVATAQFAFLSVKKKVFERSRIMEELRQGDMKLVEKKNEVLAKRHPSYYQVLLKERDIWMAHSLHEVEAMAVRDAPKVSMEDATHVLPSSVVCVVGMGHLPGIIEEWGKLEDLPSTPEERQNVLMELAKVPPPSASDAIVIAIAFAVAVAFPVAVAEYILYKSFTKVLRVARAKRSV